MVLQTVDPMARVQWCTAAFDESGVVLASDSEQQRLFAKALGPARVHSLLRVEPLLVPKSQWIMSTCEQRTGFRGNFTRLSETLVNQPGVAANDCSTKRHLPPLPAGRCEAEPPTCRSIVHFQDESATVA